MPQICGMCGQQLDETDFYKKKNGARLPLCRSCICKEVDVYNPFTFLKILEWVDKPYLKEEWEAIIKAQTDKVGKANVQQNPKSIVNRYLSRMDLASFAKLTWKDSDHL